MSLQRILKVWIPLLFLPFPIQSRSKCLIHPPNIPRRRRQTFELINPDVHHDHRPVVRFPDLNLDIPAPGIQRPRIVGRDANFALGAKDSPVQGGQLSLVLSGRCARGNTRGAVQLVCEDGAGLQDSVEDDLIGHVVWTFLEHFAGRGVYDGDLGILVDEEGVVGYYFA